MFFNFYTFTCLSNIESDAWSVMFGTCLCCDITSATPHPSHALMSFNSARWQHLVPLKFSPSPASRLCSEFWVSTLYGVARRVAQGRRPTPTPSISLAFHESSQRPVFETITQSLSLITAQLRIQSFRSCIKGVIFKILPRVEVWGEIIIFQCK